MVGRSPTKQRPPRDPRRGHGATHEAIEGIRWHRVTTADDGPPQPPADHPPSPIAVGMRRHPLRRESSSNSSPNSSTTTRSAQTKSPSAAATPAPGEAPASDPKHTPQLAETRSHLEQAFIHLLNDKGFPTLPHQPPRGPLNSRRNLRRPTAHSRTRRRQRPQQRTPHPQRPPPRHAQTRPTETPSSATTTPNSWTTSHLIAQELLPLRGTVARDARDRRKRTDLTLPDQDGNERQPLGSRAGRSSCIFIPRRTRAVARRKRAACVTAVPDYEGPAAVVLGVSPDPVKAVKRFHDEQGLNFTLLADEDHAVCEAYGAWGEKSMYGRKYWGRRGRRSSSTATAQSGT